MSVITKIREFYADIQAGQFRTQGYLVNSSNIPLSMLAVHLRKTVAFLHQGFQVIRITMLVTKSGES